MLLGACVSGGAAGSSELHAGIKTAQSPVFIVPETGSFAWRSGSKLVPSPRLDARKYDRMIREALTEAFAQKGYRLSSPGASDLLVSYVGGLESVLDDFLIDKLFGVNPAWHDGTKNRRYEKGTLVVDIVESETKRGVWRGAVQANVTFDLTDGERRERIGRAVELLMARFRVGY